MFERHFDSGLEDDGVVEMPAVAAGTTADDAPLVEEGDAEVGGAGGGETPGGEEVVFGAGSPDGGFGFAVDVDLLVAFAEPGWAAGADGEHGADVVAFALGLEEEVVLAGFDRVFLAVLGVEIGGGFGQLIQLDPVDVVVEEADGFFALVDDFDAGGLPERHSPEAIVGVGVLDDDGETDDLATFAEAIGEEVADGGFDGGAWVAVPEDAEEHFLVVGGALFGPVLGFGAEEGEPDMGDDAWSGFVHEHVGFAWWNAEVVEVAGFVAIAAWFGARVDHTFAGAAAVFADSHGGGGAAGPAFVGSGEGFEQVGVEREGSEGGREREQGGEPTGDRRGRSRRVHGNDLDRTRQGVVSGRRMRRLWAELGGEATRLTWLGVEVGRWRLGGCVGIGLRRAFDRT